MIVLLSPAKTLNYEDEFKAPSVTKPLFLKQAGELAFLLKQKNVKALQKLMSISPKIAQLNVERYSAYADRHSAKNARAALLAYRGDVYRGFSLGAYRKTDYEFCQKTVRILSGLYGYLRPLDLIQPYRLEMKTKLKNDHGADLYKFWGDTITKAIAKDLKALKTKEVINLASIEYSKSVHFNDLDAKVTHVDFKIKKGKEFKTVAIFAKKARGIMANYIVQNRIKSSKDLVGFSEEGYRFQKSLSSDDRMTFTRK